MARKKAQAVDEGGQATPEKPLRQRPEAVERFEAWQAQHEEECGPAWPHQPGEECKLPPPVAVAPHAHEDSEIIRRGGGEARTQ